MSPINSRPASPVQQNTNPEAGSPPVNGNTTSHDGHDIEVTANLASESVVKGLSGSTEELAQQNQNPLPSTGHQTPTAFEDCHNITLETPATSLATSSGFLDKISRLFSRNKSPAAGKENDVTFIAQNGAILVPEENEPNEKSVVVKEINPSEAVLEVTQETGIYEKIMNNNDTVLKEKKSNSGWGFWRFNRNSAAKKQEDTKQVAAANESSDVASERKPSFFSWFGGSSTQSAQSDVIVEQSNTAVENGNVAALDEKNGSSVKQEKTWFFARWFSASNKPAAQERVIVERSSTISENEDATSTPQGTLEMIKEEE